MKYLVSIAIGGFVLAAGHAHAQPGDKAMAVFVTAAPVADVKKVDKETENRLAAAIKDAKTKRADLEKSLKAQHGKKREAWPQDANALLGLARCREAREDLPGAVRAWRAVLADPGNPPETHREAREGLARAGQ